MAQTYYPAGGRLMKDLLLCYLIIMTKELIMIMRFMFYVWFIPKILAFLILRIYLLILLSLSNYFTLFFYF